LAEAVPWTMHFALSGVEALMIMEANQVDVVVTDMRMPGMDGAALLEEVRRRNPHAARLVLSGYSDVDAACRTIGLAHQYYEKPCPVAVLKDGVNRSLATRRMLSLPPIIERVGGTGNVPVLPPAVADVLEARPSQKDVVTEMARAVETDAELAAGLLRLANAAYFHLAVSVGEVGQAIRLLGFDVVRSLAVLCGVTRGYLARGVAADELDRLERASLRVGAAARAVAIEEKLSPTEIEQSQCAGMLAHVGSLPLAIRLADHHGPSRYGADLTGGDIVEREERTFALSHAEVGAALLSLWGFTDPIIEAVMFHHFPARCPTASTVRVSPVLAVHVAQTLVDDSAANDQTLAGLDSVWLRRLGVIDHIPAWRTAIDRLIGGPR